MALVCLGFVGCKPTTEAVVSPIVNGGFESADLSGWTVEYGDAFNDDCVSSQQTFMFENDSNNNVLSINHTGNWYLTGKAKI